MHGELPAGHAVRSPSSSDMQAILALVAACQTHEFGSPDPAMLEGVELTPSKPGFDAVRDSWMVEAEKGALVGYAHVSPPDSPQLYAHVCVHPDSVGHGFGTHLARLVETRVRERLGAAASARTLHQWIGEPNAAAHALLQAHGYRQVRQMWGMFIELRGAPEEAAWPEGITVRACAGEEDLRRAHAVVNEAFRDHWNYEEQSFEQFAANLIAIPQFDSGLWFLALDGDEAVAAALCEFLAADHAWVNDVAVRRPWRRRGLGLALLHHAFGEFYRRGARSAALGVDSANLTGATRLYERAGMHVERQYDVFELQL